MPPATAGRSYSLRETAAQTAAMARMLLGFAPDKHSLLPDTPPRVASCVVLSVLAILVLTKI